MKTIKIKIPEMGRAIGTTKWVYERLEKINSSLRLSSTSDGEPCLTYEHWDWGDAKKGKPVRHILCFIVGRRDKERSWGYKPQGKAARIHALRTKCEDGLFNVLTLDAYEITEGYLEEVTQKFIEEYEKQ